MPDNSTAPIVDGMHPGRVSTDAQYFETVIIGTGFSALLAAIRLQQQQFDDFVRLERSSDLGGTWRDNAYPGAEVEVPTGLYSISFVPYPSRKQYAPQSELLAYTRHIISKFQLRERIRTNQGVTRLTWDESRCVWNVETASGERYVARLVIDTSGVLANPRTPCIEGTETFQGVSFHTAQWNHDVPFAGKRVGVIGSGYPNYFKVNGPNTGTGHNSQISYMQTMVSYAVKAIRAVKRKEGIRAIDARSDVQQDYVAQVKKQLKSTVWQTGGCTAF